MARGKTGVVFKAVMWSDEQEMLPQIMGMLVECGDRTEPSGMPR